MEQPRVLKLERHGDNRGSFTEVFRGNWAERVRPWPQANISHSKKGVLRGMHFHKQQSDWWYCVSGEMQVALYDLRVPKAEPELHSLHQDSALVIPPLVAHGFLALTDVTLLYLVDRYYTGEDEFGIAYDDPDMAIPWWGAAALILSERDETNPSLKDVLSAKAGLVGAES